MESSDRGQKPTNQINGGPQRQTSEEMQKQRIISNDPKQQSRQSDTQRGPVPDQKKTNSEHVTPQQTTQNQKSTLKSSEDQKKTSFEESKPVGNQARRGSVKLDLGKLENGKSAYDKSPSSKTQTVLYRFTRNSSGS